MPTDFKPRGTSSFDQESGVHIPLPRILPHTFQDGREGVEYQFSIRRGDERIDGLGFFGTEGVIEASGQREWVFTIDLSSESALRSMLRSKESIGRGAVSDGSRLKSSIIAGNSGLVGVWKR